MHSYKNDATKSERIPVLLINSFHYSSGDRPVGAAGWAMVSSRPYASVYTHMYIIKICLNVYDVPTYAHPWICTGLIQGNGSYPVDL